MLTVETALYAIFQLRWYFWQVCINFNLSKNCDVLRALITMILSELINHICFIEAKVVDSLQELNFKYSCQPLCKLQVTFQTYTELPTLIWKHMKNFVRQRSEKKQKENKTKDHRGQVAYISASQNVMRWIFWIFFSWKYRFHFNMSGVRLRDFMFNEGMPVDIWHPRAFHHWRLYIISELENWRNKKVVNAADIQREKQEEPDGTKKTSIGRITWGLESKSGSSFFTPILRTINEIFWAWW